jgi:thioredoxin 1
MKEAIAKAKAENKPIFFDAYASWCGPCKYMDAYIFTRPDIGDFFNNNFICVRMDMEKGEGPELKKRYTSVDGYPSFLFLGSDGNVIKTLLGSRSGNILIEEAKPIVGELTWVSLIFPQVLIYIR